MRKVYYIYNPKTRTYDRIYPTVRQRALSILRPFVCGNGLGGRQFHYLIIDLWFSVREGAPYREYPFAGPV